ncbi:hypothetical protein GCM10010967_38780 [Dyadobacter beijingensis]|uniref:Glycosyl transferase n=1 Tax=Dyadobacter beijingensis TaxID=365489 RepID=A0ABQ2I844_9BACT|nr:hypothetical protein [Dyadobacter beijingensis]GGN00727.1 hypothetical protein GCM10010967_38780 [Dyadobacter beijingensis]
MNIIYTVCNRTNLAHALALADSVLQHQPGDTFYIGLVDSITVDNLPGHVKLLPVSALSIPGWDQMAAAYYDFELLPACRPWFALELLKKHTECRQLTFLSPTTLLKGAFNGLLNAESEMFLTPNISAPLRTSPILDDKRILNAGMYHSGSWTLRPSDKTRAMLEWWAHRTIDRANFDLCNGMNTDQLWLNYVPVWVPATTTLHNAGWHYGLNAVLNKNLTANGNSYQVDGQPLVSLEFAGLGHFDPIWSDHAPLVTENKAYQALFIEYQRIVIKKKNELELNGEPAFGKFANILPNRLMRKGIAAKLKQLTTYIDQF